MTWQDPAIAEFIDRRKGARSRLPAAHAASVVVVDDPRELSRYIRQWEELAANALEPNVFFEHWMLLPALEEFAGGRKIRLALVFLGDARAPDAGTLIGLIPLEQIGRFRGLPFSHLATWKHLHCYLCTPLVHRRHARECIGAFLAWLAANPRGSRLIEWRYLAADGPFVETLTGVVDDTRHVGYSSAHVHRALLKPRSGGEAYLKEALSASGRKEFRRLQRRLSETSAVEYVELGPQEPADPWIRDFLALEASGWRGNEGTAFASSAAGRRFFLGAMTAAAQRGQLMMLGLRANGRFVAMKCNLLAGDGAFAFKIAYDESYSKFSPGTLLELENIHRFHARPGLRWMDSCADPGHFMVNRLWLDRRPLVTVVTAAGGVLHRLLVHFLPLLRQLYRAVRPAVRTPDADEAAPRGNA